MKRIFRFFSGFFMGALIGSTLVFLLTPGSGPENREQISSRVQKTLDEFKNVASEKRTELEKELARLRQPAE
ncbi:MAG: YtxH domain-containing protein [Anaerolineaceae bacterium]|nr:YtxH domain-containing protein [Anaerolineaceae bacterium]